MKTIMVVFGTRPEAIKMAPLVKALNNRRDIFKTIVVVTGQHREMLDQVLEIFEIVPDFDLNIMKSGQDLYDVTSLVLTGMRSVINKVNPDLVLVHGDTTTSTSAALAAFYCKIPVGHVEAGLRTGNIYSPWPEEMNRKLTGQIAEFHFSPTANSRKNLMNEGIGEEKILVSGNTVIDALRYIIEKISTDIHWKKELNEAILSKGYDVARLNGNKRRMVLITAHRRENFGDGIKNICRAIIELAHKNPDVDFIYPVHPNPNIRKSVIEAVSKEGNNNIFIISPLDYPSFIYMMSLASLLLSDSGGVQEEAVALGKNLLVMRDKTERPEALTTGIVKLVGSNNDTIISEATKILGNDNNKTASVRVRENPFGDGKASEKIVDYIESHLT